MDNCVNQNNVDLQNEGGDRSQNPRVFQYTARNADGKVETGTINGYSKLDVNTFLIQECKFDPPLNSQN